MFRFLTSCFGSCRRDLSTFYAVTVSSPEHPEDDSDETPHEIVHTRCGSAVDAASYCAVTAAGCCARTSPTAHSRCGDMAPDFAIHGATRFGLLRDGGKLSDYRGQTVVLWLFFKARTKG